MITTKCSVVDLTAKSSVNSGSAVFTGYFKICCDQSQNNYDTYLFRAFLAVRTALLEVYTPLAV